MLDSRRSWGLCRQAPAPAGSPAIVGFAGRLPSRRHFLMSEDERPDNPTAYDATARTADSSAMLVARGRDGTRAVAANGHPARAVQPALATSVSETSAGVRAPKRPTPPPPGYTREPPIEPIEARTRTRLKKLRMFAILVAILLLGLVSFAFGMFMAVASDLPKLENSSEFNNASNSVLLDDHGNQIAILSQQHRILLKEGQVPQPVINAVISVEDKRFYHNSGIDIRGIGRAILADVLHGGAVQGASTIEQQFVKNVLQAQSHRTIFEKLREAALAYHLSRRWPKNKIITEYLNTIYFGNGAYGIESAAQTYFGHMPGYIGCGSLTDLCVTQLQYHPADEALLAGLIASPSGFDPIAYPAHALARRAEVLNDMLAQGYINRSQYDTAMATPLPTSSEVQAPELTTEGGYNTGYFDDWVQQQVINRYGAQRAFEGGLKITTSLDLQLQQAAEDSINAYLGNPDGPSASLVAIDNATGQVKAMVGGRNYDASPFNLATQGERQPGSAFKAFDLAAALEHGISPYSVWPSHPLTLRDPHGGVFVVRNDESSYAGTNTLLAATTLSDNTVYAQVGVKVGTHRIAGLAHRMGITTPISTNYAMTIGGLSTGVTVLDMAHAYETIAEGGRRVSGSLVAGGPLSSYSPVGIEKVRFPNGHEEVDTPVYRRVLPAWVASTETSMLETVITSGTGTNAAIGGFAAGKTGTTSNYADAWFVGWNNKYTVAVWVGYPNKLVPMETDFGGSPVLGGTYPALIWRDFMLSAMSIANQGAAGTTPTPASAAAAAAAAGGGGGATSSASSSSGSATAAPSGRGTAGGTGGGANKATPTPAPSPVPASPAPAGGQGTGGGQGAATPSAPAASTPAPAATAPSGTGGGGGAASPGASGGSAAPPG